MNERTTLEIIAPTVEEAIAQVDGVLEVAAVQPESVSTNIKSAFNFRGGLLRARTNAAAACTRAW